MAEVYTNLASSTTTGAIDNTTNPVTFSVQTGDGAKFPATTNGSFRIIIDNEILLVTSRTTDSLTASRAQEGTAIAAHNLGATVTHVLTAGAMDQIRKDLSRTGTGAVPTTGRQGDLYLPTDAPLLWQHDGTAFRAFGPICRLTDPTTQTWSWVNQGTATVTSNTGYIYLLGTADAGTSARMRVKTIPTAPYTITACLMFSVAGGNVSNFWQGGLCVYDSVSTKLQFFGPIFDGSWRVISYNLTTPTGGAGSATVQESVASAGTQPNLMWLRLRDDGTNRIWSMSSDGINFTQFVSVLNTNFVTPNQVGFFVDSNTSSKIGAVSLLSWLEGS